MTADNANANAADLAQIRGLIESCAKAIRSKNADEVVAHYAPDLVAFDMMPPLRLDRAAYKNSYAQWFSSIEGPLDYEPRELQIAASGDVGFSSMISHVISTTKRGEKRDSWVRVTVGLRKINGKWLAVHEHVSLPFDMSTGKAVTDLTP
jgi:uncharacterized protein (TIGR02246 family)